MAEGSVAREGQVRQGVRAAAQSPGDTLERRQPQAGRPVGLAAGSVVGAVDDETSQVGSGQSAQGVQTPSEGLAFYCCSGDPLGTKADLSPNSCSHIVQSA